MLFSVGVRGQGKRSNSFDALTDLGMSLLDPLKEVEMGCYQGQQPHTSSSASMEGPSSALNILWPSPDIQGIQRPCMVHV